MYSIRSCAVGLGTRLGLYPSCGEDMRMLGYWSIQYSLKHCQDLPPVRPLGRDVPSSAVERGGVSRVSYSGPRGVKGPPGPANTYRPPIVRLCGST